jgi:esterase/lipase superfamily enzyme
MKSVMLLMKLGLVAAAALVVMLVWLRFMGGRPMAPIILAEPQIGMIYDTKFEEEMASGKSPEVFSAAFRPYVEILDEPVGIIGWRDGVSTWEVFFATNRGLVPATAGTTQARFGNEVLTAPLLGRAEISLPKRARGGNPRRESAESQAPTDVATFRTVRSLPQDELAAGVGRQVKRSRQRDLLLFVHGFNVDFESALIRTAQVASDMPFNGAVVAYSWPSQGGVNSYGTDEPINAQSVQPFTQFLRRLLADVPPGTRINILVHSMGNRLVMRALGQLPPPTGHKPIANLVLCAPDVGIADFRAWAAGTTAQCEQVTLYASSSDTALIISKGLHNEQRAGDAQPPVVVPGIVTIDCSALEFDFLGHSYYGNNLDVLTDLFRLLKERRGPETCQYLTRRQCGSGDGCFWQFTSYAPRMGWNWNFPETIMR